jgi:hypothetical protein
MKKEKDSSAECSECDSEIDKDDTHYVCKNCLEVCCEDCRSDHVKEEEHIECEDENEIPYCNECNEVTESVCSRCGDSICTDCLDKHVENSHVEGVFTECGSYSEYVAEKV